MVWKVINRLDEPGRAGPACRSVF